MRSNERNVRRPEGYAASLAKRIAGSLVGLGFLSLIIVKFLASFRVAAPYPTVVTLLILAVVPFVMARLIEEQPIPETVLADPYTERSFPEADDAVRVVVARWILRLETPTDSHRTALVLIELASDRLRLVHGVDPATDPERVRRLVGPNLWRLLSEGPTPLPPDVLARVITEMEAL